MGEQTAISWCHHTFNPWIGCTKVSPGCDHCYAERDNGRRKWVQGWGAHGERKRTSAGNWRNPIKWNAAAQAAGRRARVFTASLADIFDNQAQQQWRDDLFALIERTPALDWLLLTKRPQNVARMAPHSWFSNGFPSNVWMGATVENQVEAERRMPLLLQLPARILFASCEPLLDMVNLRPWLGRGEVSWVIGGGESGPAARPVQPVWARSLRDQCAEARIAFHWKQWGEWDADALLYTDTDGRSPPPSMRVGVNRSGRLLDGVLHDAFPEVLHG